MAIKEQPAKYVINTVGRNLQPPPHTGLTGVIANSPDATSADVAVDGPDLVLNGSYYDEVAIDRACVLRHVVADTPASTFQVLMGAVGSEVLAFSISDATGLSLVGDTTLPAGDLTMTEGNLLLSLGNITLTNGDLDITSGGATLTSGDLTLTAGRLLRSAPRTTTADNVNATDWFVLGDATAGALTLTLPAVAVSSGRQLTFKKSDASGNAVTLDGAGAETIDGATTLALSTQYKSATIACNGVAWFIMSSNL